MTGSDSPETSGSTEERRLNGPALYAALLAMLLWALFPATLAVSAGSASAEAWARLTLVFGSVQAVAAAAGGALWGASVQQERAVTAERAARSNSRDAARGRALAALVVADEEPGGEDDAAPQLKAAGGATPGWGGDRGHARVARSLFPDLR